MISMDSFRKNLGSHASDYSEEELTLMRRDLYQLAYLAYSFYKNNIYKKTNNIE